MGISSLKSVGSSPLARGLQHMSSEVGRARRIIPARAGFTVFATHTCTDKRDHPRSRGVYGGEEMVKVGEMGSSPLARGLLAGPRAARVRRRDHPRSRGVYLPIDPTIIAALGSSPLARGLPRLFGEDEHQPGIIPARAGFTRAQVVPQLAPGDHPRSRGVYWTPATVESPVSGSSPLARGLLWRILRASSGMGIIPARAGFTGDVDGAHDAGGGSSPLARGLLGAPVIGRVIEGIIPARAGFTLPTRFISLLTWDHPRSRGVYNRSLYPGKIENGSSPLARGLRQVDETAAGEAGIIPARAGFTLGGRRGHPRHQDHPRSRGVYRTFFFDPRISRGSSPLARGLRPAGL